jgi:2-methylisocitrate lyase-like PEP mutase family enzyme
VQTEGRSISHIMKTSMNISPEQHSKAKSFQALHQKPETFVMPCAWDPSSAIMFEELGFQCIGTTSGGVNWAQGRRDYVYSTPREQMLEAYAAIARATSLPVSGDLENGYGESPAEVAETIRESINLGMVGGSIEDQNMNSNGQLFNKELAVERIAAARETSDSTGLTYTLTARCEVFSSAIEGPYAEAVDRLNRYRAVGADCLFVPGLSDIKTLRRLVQDVDGPISFGMGASAQPLTTSVLTEIGIRRISTGGGLPRAAFSLIRNAAAEILANGTFDYLENAISDPNINEYFQQHGPGVFN